MILINGAPAEAISVHDRGLMYGDGVFRTLLVRRGSPLDWERHYRKLTADCAALALACPSREILALELERLAQACSESVAKIVVTRGPGGRGYFPGAAATPTRIVMIAPRPAYPEAYRRQGVRIRLCQMRLAIQPRLAGIKHLNRLENVLARAEWSDPDTAEGLMLDWEGNVVEGTMTNLFLVAEGKLITPDLSRCGVAGVQRERVLEYAQTHGFPTRVAQVSMKSLLEADEVFLTNSLIGLWPVAEFQDVRWSVGPITERIQAGLYGDWG